jgi:hypothetical protein
MDVRMPFQELGGDNTYKEPQSNDECASSQWNTAATLLQSHCDMISEWREQGNWSQTGKKIERIYFWLYTVISDLRLIAVYSLKVGRSVKCAGSCPNSSMYFECCLI